MDKQYAAAQPAQGYGMANQQQAYAQIPPPSTPAAGVISMTENAHSAFEQLTRAFGELCQRLGPITESYPEPGCGEGTLGQQTCEASAVVGLRILVDRINTKTAEIYRLTEAVRV